MSRHAIALLCLGSLMGASYLHGAEHADLPPSHSVQPELVATGFAFAAGPALNAAGDLFVANYRELGTIGRIATDGTAAIFCDLRTAVPLENRMPQANGVKLDGEGRLIVADIVGGRLLRVAADGGKVEVLAERSDGKRFDGLSDVALDRQGNIYFTDPGSSTAQTPTGSVYRYDVRTGRVALLATGLAFPNGVAVTVDQQKLCVAESRQYRVLVFDLTRDGKATNQRVLVDFPDETRGTFVGGKFDPDGMVFDAKNRLYVAMWRGGVINVVDVEAGLLIRQYDAGGAGATNCHFHNGYLYTAIAAKEAVFRLKLGVDGFDYHGALSRRKPLP
ncbi:MAG: SMP-30/gluconolactonase/LRE family protein [Patescibacteria group bacterium]|nr:SMP-30/gluconolactonase/LRE family protein [Patescibacteria group bacterium]